MGGPAISAGISRPTATTEEPNDTLLCRTSVVCRCGDHEQVLVSVVAVIWAAFYRAPAARPKGVYRVYSQAMQKRKSWKDVKCQYHTHRQLVANMSAVTIFIVLSSWPTTRGHCESSLGSFDECSAAHKRPSTLRPSHLTWAVSRPLGSCRLQPPSPFIIITQPESWYSFTVPRRVEGWVDLWSSSVS